MPIYHLATLCLNGTLSCVDLVDVIMGDIPPGQAGPAPPPPMQACPPVEDRQPSRAERVCGVYLSRLAY